MLQDSIIYSVKILHVERREEVRAVEGLGEEPVPGVVPHEHHSFPCKGARMREGCLEHRNGQVTKLGSQNLVSGAQELQAPFLLVPF